ncbi:hypothetical protein VII00023_06727 [Vibrio ichthyoenteri ATCC 700023]|uniref:Uncharacterized protein n=1 Tax=Vibrio ichthyoenteri ATCC 700023 TaxID=870968 RepID=F9RZB8_9VIBR|nr:hypothetical protein VII00023_06727 [Vibrio ichthyoenteri ATCC 700023]
MHAMAGDLSTSSSPLGGARFTLTLTKVALPNTVQAIDKDNQQPMKDE